MAAVGEPVLSAVLLVLFDRLESPELLQFVRQEGLRKQLYKWNKTLMRILNVLDDAEEKQHTERSVKDWLDDLRDLAYDAEDILDEVATEAALRRTLMGESQASTSKVRNLVPSWLTGLTPSAVKIKIRLGSKIKKITARFNDLVAQKDQLKFKENVISPRPSKRRESTSVVTEDRIYGREKVVEAILQLLISDKPGDALTKVNVISIVGMGGIGKTTLAQLIYNDNKVQSFFDLKAWVCVSQDFDTTAVTKTILQTWLTSENCDGKDQNWLQVKLEETLFGKKFLVILDDVWNEKPSKWNSLRAPFEAGAPGSSIIVTTRNQGVSSLMGSIEVPPFQLELLPNDACLPILSQHALDAKDFSAHPDLKDIGEEIVKRCKGLPLAVTTIGGLLRRKNERNEWNKVLKNKIWDIVEERSGIAPALMLSYHNLPSHLKRCFAYCSILPKDYEFEEEEVVLLWMAEGLIRPRQVDDEMEDLGSRQVDDEMEDLGSEYFRNLLSRSFFQQSGFDKSRFLMHDLINDLAQSVAGETCFRMEYRVGSSHHGNLPIKARHSSYLGSKYDVAKKFEVFSKLTGLRTFLPLMLPNSSYLARYVPLELVPAFQRLRVLSFKGYCITELSESVGDLKHLRYLDLSQTHIRSLPESIATLYNLQTLLLKNCIKLEKLPSMLCNLVNLRHLNIEGRNCLEGMPVQIGKLSRLRTLSNLIVGRENCSGLKELGPLKHLKGKLNISRLENVIEPKDAKDAELIKKNKISVLELQWSSDIDELKDRTSELEVLNGLRPHDALTELDISYYDGTKFPHWLTSPSFPNMVSLRLENCYKCTSLPPLGEYLPSLKKLCIGGMRNVKSVGSEFCGCNLETLQFDDMEEWENWSPREEFPNLRKLSLHRCPKLLGNLPQEFPNLRELFLDYCPKLLGKLPNNLPLLNKAVIYECDLLVVSLSYFPDKCKLEIEGLDKGLVELKNSDEGLDMEGLAKLKTLTIRNCEERKNLWSDNMGSLPHDLQFLYRLNDYNCPKLLFMVAEEVDQERLQLRITSIRIRNCIALESLPKALMYNNTCLQYIEIEDCDSLTHFARSLLPPTLKRLHIWNCKSMRNLVEDDDNDTYKSSCSSGITSLLEELEVGYCASLESLTSSGELPTTLQCLQIESCPKLESVAKSFRHNSSLKTINIKKCESLQFLNLWSDKNTCDLQTHFDNSSCSSGVTSILEQLFVYDCPSLESLTSSGELPTTLQRLEIGNCPKLESVAKSFPEDGLVGITIRNCENLQLLNGGELLLPSSLGDLKIENCPSILSFPKEGFPTNLTILSVSRLKFTEALFDWGLDNLTSLNKLHIGGCKHLVSFPKMTLPASLTSLWISDFSNLKCLSSEGLRKLTSLETLLIDDCENLMYFPEVGLLPSLLKLCISNCQKLRSLPKKGLPPSLQKLVIFECPLLEERYKKDQRGELRKIADIPCVEIMGKNRGSKVALDIEWRN